MTSTTSPLFQLDYGGKLEREIAKLITAFEEIKFDTGRYPQRWLAIKLLEADVDILGRVQTMPNGAQVITLAQKGTEHLKSMLGDDVDLLTADRRYGYINGVVRQSLHRPLCALHGEPQPGVRPILWRARCAHNPGAALRASRNARNGSSRPC